MAYTARSKDNAGDVGRAADQNESVDNDDFLYDNLGIENYSYAAHRPSASVGAASDEFNASALNVAWTAFGGLASGTVAEGETGAIDKYDLATFPGWLAMQSNNDGPSVVDFGVYKSWAPGTGPWSVIAKVAVFESGTLETNKDQKIGFLVSDDTTPTNYTYLRAGMEGGGPTFQAECGTQGGSTAVEALGTSINARCAYYLAMVRLSAGGNTQFWASVDGLSWRYIAATAGVTAVSYLWITVMQDLPTIRPIYMCDFIRTFDTATKICGRAGTT